jgi:16S rRNA (guanine527-N7)-methyltransferase
VCRALGWPLDPAQIGALERFGSWLVDEAMRAGALGPHEGDRILDRHLVDSLLFSRPWGRTDAPQTLIDLGTGAGLPGIPLAIMWPESAVALVDRSERTADLARRAIRVLGLDNASVLTSEIERVTDRAPFVVARAVQPPERLSTTIRRLLSPGGTGVIGGSQLQAPTLETMDAATDILDRSAPLFIIRG